VARGHERGWALISSFLPCPSSHVQLALYKQYCTRGDMLGFTAALHWLSSLKGEAIDWANFAEWESLIMAL